MSRLIIYIFLLICSLRGQVHCESYMQDNKTEDSIAIFAAGCFWCTEAAFDCVKGVKETTVGYIGGTDTSPTYEKVSSGETGHYECIEIVYDSGLVSYEELLKVFWDNIDPTDQYGQFVDQGSQYLTAIFYLDEKQKEKAEIFLKQEQKKIKDKVVTKVLPASQFYPAEDYHQEFYLKNPLHYRSYRDNSGRK